MAILGEMIMKHTNLIGKTGTARMLSPTLFYGTLLPLLLLLFVAGCKAPDEDIVLRNIKDVVVDAHDDPTLKANAIFFNPNKVRGRLKKIDVAISVNGRRVGHVDQGFNTVIPANGEFTVPLQVNLAMKELGFMDTLLGMVGGKKMDIRYEGFLKLSYHGIPIKVPINHKDEIRIRF